MADLGGFTTTFPSSDPANAEDPSHDKIIARKFTAPSSGTLDINEIGVYIAFRQSTGDFRFAIYDDGTGEPGSLVTNSLTSEVNIDAVGWKTIVYGTKPQVTAGVDYWLAIWGDNAAGAFEISVDLIASSGTQQQDTETYHSTNNPGAASWSNYAHAIQVAAEYQAAAGATGQAFRLRAIEKYFMPIFDNITGKIKEIGQYIRGMIKGKKRITGGQCAGPLFT